MKVFKILVVFLAQHYDAYDIPPERNFYLDQNYKDRHLNYTVPDKQSNSLLNTPPRTNGRSHPYLNKEPVSEKQDYFEDKQTEERITNISLDISPDVDRYRTNLYLYRQKVQNNNKNFHLNKNAVSKTRTNPYLDRPQEPEVLDHYLGRKQDSNKQKKFHLEKQRVTNIRKNLPDKYPDSKIRTNPYSVRPLVLEVQDHYSDHQLKSDEPDLGLTEGQQEPNMQKNPYLSKYSRQIRSNPYLDLINKSDKLDRHLDRKTYSDTRTNPYLNILLKPNRSNPYLHRQQEPIRNNVYLTRHPDSKTRKNPYLGRQQESDKQNLYLDWQPRPEKHLNFSLYTPARLNTKVNSYQDQKPESEQQDHNPEREPDSDELTNSYLERQKLPKMRKNLNKLPTSDTVSNPHLGPQPESDKEEGFSVKPISDAPYLDEQRKSDLLSKPISTQRNQVRYQEPVTDKSGFSYEEQQTSDEPDCYDEEKVSNIPTNPDLGKPVTDKNNLYLQPGYVNNTRPVPDVREPQSYRKYDQHRKFNPQRYRSPTTARPDRAKQRKGNKMKYLYRSTCGIDNSDIDPVYAGSGKVETYPWLGVLNYPMGKVHASTAVVLITKQLVIASAMDIHKIPKNSFRQLARVVLGSNCSVPGVPVLDYNYHQEYRRRTYSTLALVQLDITDFTYRKGLRPICGPPKKITATKFYAIVLPDDCQYSRVNILEMDYVPQNKCENFYRRNGLNVNTLWPTHVVCGRAKSEGECVWKDGTVLALKQDGKWHLMGLGINGPGCGAPSRFVDYSAYHDWVGKSVARMGRPSITRLDENEVIMRKTRHIQRFGRCDTEEVKYELYTDTVRIDSNKLPDRPNTFRYNLTILTDIDYSCVFFRAENLFPMKVVQKPRLEIRSYCSTPWPICLQAGLEKIEFFVEIKFLMTTIFKLEAYGRMRPMIDTKAMMKYTNEKRHKPNMPWTWTENIDTESKDVELILKMLYSDDEA